MWEPSQRYPDPNVQVLDRRSTRCVCRSRRSSNWRRLPLVEGRCISATAAMSCGPTSQRPHPEMGGRTGVVSVFRKTRGTRTATPAIARAPRHLRHRGRRVSRTEYDGTITTLMDSYEGKRLNSPTTWW